jgi:hypothetical protein
MMTFEAQIVLRRDNPQQLADDVRAISEFIENRQRGARRATGDTPSSVRPRRLQAVASGD